MSKEIMTAGWKRTTLITGASSGIGAVYPDRLAHRGYELILVARNRERLDALATRVFDETRWSVKVIVADLNSKADLAQIEQVLRNDASITMLVNNAGIAMSGDLQRRSPSSREHDPTQRTGAVAAGGIRDFRVSRARPWLRLL